MEGSNRRRIVCTKSYQTREFGNLVTFTFLVKCLCRGGRTADAKGWLKRGGGSKALVGCRGEVGMRERGTQDIPRFGALWRDNTPSPAKCGLYVTVQSRSSSCMEEEGGRAKA